MMLTLPLFRVFAPVGCVPMLLCKQPSRGVVDADPDLVASARLLDMVFDVDLDSNRLVLLPREHKSCFGGQFASMERVAHMLGLHVIDGGRPDEPAGRAIAGED
jgi:hypothetical protein